MNEAVNQSETVEHLWQELQSLQTESSTLLPHIRDDWALACARNAEAQADVWRRLATRADKPAWRYAAARMALILDQHATTMRDGDAPTSQRHPRRHHRSVDGSDRWTT